MLFSRVRLLPMPPIARGAAAQASDDLAGLFAGPSPAHVYPPHGATLYEVSPPGPVALVAAAGAVAVPASLALVVPSGRVAVVRSLSMFLNDLVDATDVRFTLRVNGAPVPGMTQLRMAGRAAAWLERVVDDRPLVTPRGPVRIDWEILNVDGGAHNASVTYSGWHFDPRLLRG